MKKLFLLVVLVAAAAIYPMAASASPTSTTGTVVARSGHLIAIASPSGAVQTVRSSSAARVGSRVRVTGSTVRVIGRAHSAHIRGVVVRSAAGRLVLAAGRSLVAVRTGSRRFSSVESNNASTPAVGTTVDTTTSITAAGQLAVASMTTGASVGSIQVQATVQSVAPGAIVVAVNGSPIQFTLPAGMTLPASLVGQTISLTLNLSSADAVATPGGQQADDDENDDNDEQGDNEGDHQHEHGGGDD
jgi:hypothetical protein